MNTPDLLEFVPNVEWLPNPVDVQDLKYLNQMFQVH